MTMLVQAGAHSRASKFTWPAEQGKTHHARRAVEERSNDPLCAATTGCTPRQVYGIFGQRRALSPKCGAGNDRACGDYSGDSPMFVATHD